MDKFDEMIKESISKEKWDTPKSLDERLENTYESLSTIKSHKRFSLKIGVLVASIMMLTITTALAANSETVQNAINTVKNYFSSNTESRYSASKNSLEKFNDEVGITVEDKGIKITLDSVSADENFMNLFYTIESDKPIKISEKEMEMISDIKDLSPCGHFTIGENHPVMKDCEVYFESEYKVKAMARIGLNNIEIKENDKLVLELVRVLFVEGDWKIETVLDKSKIQPAIKSVRPNEHRIINCEDIEYDINIEKVSISPLGNIVTIKSNNEKIFNNFVLFDDKGESLDVLPTGVSGIGEIGSVNSFEFLKANKDTKYIKLVPVDTRSTRQYPEPIIKDIADLPVEFERASSGSVIVEDIKSDKNTLKIKYRKKGLVHSDVGGAIFLDDDGNEIEPLYNEDKWYQIAVDREDNSYTAIVTSYNKECDYSKCTKVLMYPEYEYKLLEDQAIIINLE
ncbi:DUF4179 domain-containing protein [Clostridium senegalense]|uniref:DUF4179 domain-containing protein n=1 Tax=Clostridium senegalense TaxID=1465809 RepID=A0A6M0H9A6_9CLOT|nr:DUF4179 domain-containing protein [Clostridium senegalense]NEU06212.1 DUF4179 domain-containing protein [Clostridium senegalense]